MNLTPLFRREQAFVANFYLYADESGKMQKSEYTSFCGFVAYDLEWWRFYQEWESCRFSWEVPAIHMAYIHDPTRDKSGAWGKVKDRWGNTWEHRKQDMLQAFARVIRTSNLVCVGSTIDSEHFVKMPDKPYKQAMGNDPLYLAFYNLVRNAIDKMDNVQGHHTLSVIIDDDQQSAHNYYDLLGSMRKQFPKDVSERISELGFANDVAFPGLQAADMIAYESRSLMIAKKQDPDTEPSLIYALMTKEGLHQPTLYTPYFLDMLNNV